MENTENMGSPCLKLEQQECGLHGCSALVADDEASIRSLNTLILTHMGLQPYAAECGTDAEKLFAEHQNNTVVAVLDIDMPGMNGTELCERLRRIQPDLPVVFASGAATADIQTRLEPLQPVTFLAKPYGLKQLLISVRSAVCSVRCQHFRETQPCVNPAFAAFA